MFNPLQAILAARAGAPAPAGPPQVAPQAAPGGGNGASDLVSRAIDLLTQASQQEKDPIEREGLAKVVALLHGFAAREQKQRDAAMGAGPAVQLLRRTQQG